MIPYATFQRSHRVSIWIGDFTTAAELDEYLCLSHHFEQDFGFTLSDRNMPETTVESHPRSIAELVAGFSWSESFRDAAVAAAHRAGVTSATTMVLFHHFDFDPSQVAVAPSAPLRFIGSVPFGHETHAA